MSPEVPGSAPNLRGLFPDELVSWLGARGVPCTPREARSVLARERCHPDERPKRETVRRAVRAAVEDLVDHTRLTVVERVEDPADGFVKYLLRAPDGALSEAVRIPLGQRSRAERARPWAAGPGRAAAGGGGEAAGSVSLGPSSERSEARSDRGVLDKPDTYTVCLSSQVGCAMACDFCATGRLGLSRDLAAWEMVDAFTIVRDEAPGRVTGAVFMGQGEPLHNYDEVLRAAAVLNDPCGGRIKAEAITISTVGLVPAIRRYAAEGHRYRLIVSLTSAIAERRAALMPVTRKYGLPELAAAIREVARTTGGRVTVAWVVMAGVNTGADEVEALRDLLGDVPLRLNLIDVNDARPGGYARADEAELARFRDALATLGVPVVRRYSGGQARHAACGMLAARRQSSSSTTVSSPPETSSTSGKPFAQRPSGSG